MHSNASVNTEMPVGCVCGSGHSYVNSGTRSAHQVRVQVGGGGAFGTE